MIEDKNIFEISLESLAQILRQIDPKFEANSFNPRFNFKEIITDNIDEIKDGYI